MDAELLTWIVVFVGGYVAVLGYLLWVAMRSGKRSEPPAG